jgi:DNA polymerase III subunit epsilon
MRQIILDTETTGLSPAQGHRIIEIGCIELVNRRRTGREFHRFLNPEREIDAGAERVHGLSRAELAHHPKFAEVAEELLDFIRGAELVIHNAEFDVGFIEHELALMRHPRPKIEQHAQVLDTLGLARGLHPGQRNSLDALCRRYTVDASRRDVHGALIDAELLMNVYLAMTGGQTALVLETETASSAAGAALSGERPVRRDLTLVVLRATPEEEAEHEAFLDRMQEAAGACLWRTLAAATGLVGARIAGDATEPKSRSPAMPAPAVPA